MSYLFCHTKKKEKDVDCNTFHLSRSPSADKDALLGLTLSIASLTIRHLVCSEIFISMQAHF